MSDTVWVLAAEGMWHSVELVGGVTGWTLRNCGIPYAASGGYADYPPVGGSVCPECRGVMTRMIVER